jgi:COMM domain containing 3
MVNYPQLSKNVIVGLRLLNDTIQEDITKKLIVNAVKQMLVRGPGESIDFRFFLSFVDNFYLLALPARPEIYDSEVSLEAKQADFAVTSVLLLSAQHSIDATAFRELLDHHKISEQTKEQLSESYEKFRDELTTRLSAQGNSHNIPSWTNVSVDVQLSSGEIKYKLNLQSFDHQSGTNKTIEEIFCNQEELQSMINKLKDIERHCEKLSK